MVMFAKNRMRRQMNKRILWGKEIKVLQYFPTKI